MNITIATVEQFRQAANFLKKHEAHLESGLDDPTNIRDFRNATSCVAILARKLGEAELSIRG